MAGTKIQTKNAMNFFTEGKISQCLFCQMLITELLYLKGLSGEWNVLSKW